MGDFIQSETGTLPCVNSYRSLQYCGFLIKYHQIGMIDWSPLLAPAVNTCVPLLLLLETFLKIQT
jgi:hypothetical protein